MTQPQAPTALGCRVSLSLPLAKPVPGEGTTSWILMEEEGEERWGCSRDEVGKYKKSCVAESWKLKGKTEGEEVKVK